MASWRHDKEPVPTIPWVRNRLTRKNITIVVAGIITAIIIHDAIVWFYALYVL